MPTAAALAKRADALHEAGSIDREIDLRRDAYAVSIAAGDPLPDQIEKAAHLVCDIAESLGDPSSTEEWRQATSHADARAEIFEASVSGLARAAEPERAFALTQRLKSPFLVRRLRRHTLGRADLSATAQRYGEALGRLDQAIRTVRQARRSRNDQRTVEALIAVERQTRSDLRDVEQALRRDDPAALADFAAPLVPDDLLPLFPPDGGTCLADVYVMRQESVILLARRSGSSVAMVGMVLQSLNLPSLTGAAGGWIAALRSGDARRLEAGIEEISQFLHDHMMCSLGRYMRENGHWQVSIVPHSVLHAMPLHLAPLCEAGGQKLFCDEFGVNYSPCVQLALSTALRPRPVAFIEGKIPAFLAADPAGDLPGALHEQATVGRRLDKHPWPAAPVPHRSATGQDATVENVSLGLAEAGLAVLATHAAFVPRDPFGSGVLLNENGKGKLWTIDEIYTAEHLRNCPIVLLTACESGMSHFDDSAEVAALPPAFVSIGAGAVLSSLWPAEDVATSMMAERFTHHLLDPGETPSTALHEAVKDVRRATREAAVDRCDEILGAMEERGSHMGDAAESYVRLTAFRRRIAAGPDTPFDLPIFWGGFFVTGCGWRSGGGKVVIERRRDPEALVGMGMAIGGVKAAVQSFRERDYDEAIRLVRLSLPKLDGLWLGRALLLLGDSLYRKIMLGDVFEAFGASAGLKEALDSLCRARDILEAQGGEEYLPYCESLIRSLRQEFK